MLKGERWVNVAQEEIKKVVEATDDYKKKYIDPIAEIGNPEKLIGKPYSQWTPQDKQLLQGVYVYSPEKLEEFMAKKEVDIVWRLQKLNKSMEG